MSAYTPKDIAINIIAWNNTKEKWHPRYVSDVRKWFIDHRDGHSCFDRYEYLRMRKTTRHRLLNEEIESINTNVDDQWFKENVKKHVSSSIPKVIKQLIRQYSMAINLSMDIHFYHTYSQSMDPHPSSTSIKKFEKQ